MYVLVWPQFFFEEKLTEFLVVNLKQGKKNEQQNFNWTDSESD